VDSAIALIEANSAVGEREESVIATHSDVQACLEFCAALADDDGASRDGLPTKTFHAEPLATTIASVPCRSLSLFMRHDVFPWLFAGLDLLNFDPSPSLTVTYGAVISFSAAVFEGDYFWGAIVIHNFGYDFCASHGRFADLDFAVLDDKKNVRKLGRGSCSSSKAFNLKGLAFANLVLFASSSDDGDICHKRKEYRKRGGWARRDFLKQGARKV
jgi:hypothetical protein